MLFGTFWNLFSKYSLLALRRTEDTESLELVLPLELLWVHVLSPHLPPESSDCLLGTCRWAPFLVQGPLHCVAGKSCWFAACVLGLVVWISSPGGPAVFVGLRVILEGGGLVKAEDEVP